MIRLTIEDTETRQSVTLTADVADAALIDWGHAEPSWECFLLRPAVLAWGFNPHTVDALFGDETTDRILDRTQEDEPCPPHTD